MGLAFGIVFIVGLAVFLVSQVRAKSRNREFERHSITADELHDRLKGDTDILIYDVRQPLDFLSDAEIIPGARRVPPKDIQENTQLIPRDRDVVVYCTCPSDATARMISEKARELEFTRVKFLKGGFGGWKQKGFPVEVFPDSFHLDTAT